MFYEQQFVRSDLDRSSCCSPFSCGTHRSSVTRHRLVIPIDFVVQDPQPSFEVTVYLVLDFGKFGRPYLETDEVEADRATSTLV